MTKQTLNERVEAILKEAEKMTKGEWSNVDATHIGQPEHPFPADVVTLSFQDKPACLASISDTMLMAKLPQIIALLKEQHQKIHMLSQGYGEAIEIIREKEKNEDREILLLRRQQKTNDTLFYENERLKERIKQLEQPNDQ